MSSTLKQKIQENVREHMPSLRQHGRIFNNDLWDAVIRVMLEDVQNLQLLDAETIAQRVYVRSATRNVRPWDSLSHAECQAYRDMALTAVEFYILSVVAPTVKLFLA